MSSFENLRIVDNFYQTSLYYPMPTVVISTLAEDGSTSLGPYSLIAPYYVAGKGYYAMLLNCRNSSNTAQHILRTGKCAINFINDDPKNFKEAVKLSWPGDEPKDKMPNCKFPLEKSQIMEENPDDVRPMVISNAIQVLECTWMRELDGADRDQPGELHGYEPPYHDFNGITSQFGAHFILRIDRILMKKKYSDAIIAGVKISRRCPSTTATATARTSGSTVTAGCARSFCPSAKRRSNPCAMPPTAPTIRSSSPMTRSKPF